MASSYESSCVREVVSNTISNKAEYNVANRKNGIAFKQLQMCFCTGEQGVTEGWE
jgi:hypothetical protein